MCSRIGHEEVIFVTSRVYAFYQDDSQWNENNADDSSCADGKEEQEEDDEGGHREEKVVLELSAMLRKALERDSHLITKQNKVQ